MANNLAHWDIPGGALNPMNWFLGPIEEIGSAVGETLAR